VHPRHGEARRIRRARTPGKAYYLYFKLNGTDGAIILPEIPDLRHLSTHSFSPETGAPVPGGGFPQEPRRNQQRFPRKPEAEFWQTAAGDGGHPRSPSEPSRSHRPCQSEDPPCPVKRLEQGDETQIAVPSGRPPAPERGGPRSRPAGRRLRGGAPPGRRAAPCRGRRRRSTGMGDRRGGALGCVALSVPLTRPPSALGF
jgi:hypothetical protein